jgi:DnaK suppressor protein
MMETELNKFKNILESRHAELEQIVRNRDGIAIEKSADALDETQRAAERELAIRNLDRNSNLLRNVRSALRRIEDASFGICVHCEEEISFANGETITAGIRVPGPQRSPFGGAT